MVKLDFQLRGLSLKFESDVLTLILLAAFLYLVGFEASILGDLFWIVDSLKEPLLNALLK